MGEIRNKRIQTMRSYIDPDAPSIPVLDYDLIYPVTTYDAVHRDMEDTSTTLTAELEAIYRLISEKQTKVYGGTAGNLMTWTTTEGLIGETEIVRNIPTNPSDRSYQKVTSEKAVGTALDLKTNQADFNSHIHNTDIHIEAAERSRWNNATPIDAFREHSGDGVIHITAAERTAWNAKTDQTEFDSHVTNKNNPHSVTAYQIGAYTRREIDDMFASIRSSFFNYRNIKYDDRTNIATLEEYNPENWNPNFVLSYGSELPTDPSQIDSSKTYFALKPLEDYTVHESSKCVIWMKRPGLSWQQVGLEDMMAGDLVVRYPDTTMCVWLQGRFIQLYTASSGSGSGDGSGYLWRPVMEEIDGKKYLTFVLSAETEPPSVFDVSGPAGYTPIKGIDYFDGRDGMGVPAGGNPDDIIIKASLDDYDIEWISFGDYLVKYVNAGGTFPGITVDWDHVIGHPEIKQEKGISTTNVMSQNAVTNEFSLIDQQIYDIWTEMHSHGSVEELARELDEHVNDHNNPHAITPLSIGAVSQSEFGGHTLNQNNPHHVTAAQIGLDKVNNTSDYDKPISHATQLALETIDNTIDEIKAILDGNNLISDVIWNNATCTLTFIFRDDSEKEVVIPLIEIFETITFDDVNKELVITLPNGDEKRIDIQSLITEYTGGRTETINVTITNGRITGDVLPDSIDGSSIVDSVALRGSPTADTQPTYDNSDKLATTKFVKNTVIDTLESTDTTRPLSANMGRVLNTTKTSRSDVLRMIEDSPMLNVIDSLGSEDPYSALSAHMGYVLNSTKAPLVHTSASGSSFGRATVSLFGHARSSNVEPLMDGNVFIGTDNGYYARADHRHPSDVNKAPVHWPDIESGIYSFTGEPKSTLPPDDDESDRIATTLWVKRNPGVKLFTNEEINEIILRAWDAANA